MNAKYILFFARFLLQNHFSPDRTKKRLSCSGFQGTSFLWHYPISRIEVGQPCAQEQGWQDDQSRFRTERSARPQFRAVDLNARQGVDIQARNRESEHHPCEEFPADVQTDRKPELSRAQVAIGKINPREEDARRADPGRVRIAKMQQAEHRRGDDYTPE